MNLLSYILIGVVAVWFVIALVWLIRRRGNACGCGKGCGGDCAHCNLK